MFSNFLKNVVNTIAPEVTAPRPPSHGFRSINVEHPSPLAHIGVESRYDFLISVDGIALSGDMDWLTGYLKNAQDEVTLGIWSAKGQVTREVKIPPPTLTNMSLDLALRWAPTRPTIENVYHVLDIVANSPAARAGLKSHEDFIVGTPEGIVRGESGMSELIEDHLNKPLKLYVFNAYQNTTRDVIIVPNRQWGGQGSIGCSIGFGVLHRLPVPLTEPPEKHGQTLFEAEAPKEEIPESNFTTGAELSKTVEQLSLDPEVKPTAEQSPVVGPELQESSPTEEASASKEDPTSIETPIATTAPAQKAAAPVAPAEPQAEQKSTTEDATPAPAPKARRVPVKGRTKKGRMTAADIEAMVNEASTDSRPASRSSEVAPPPKADDAKASTETANQETSK